MDDMFAGLNDVPWPDLYMAYGSAEEAPMWIRQLASSSRELRAHAANCLLSNLEHQGSLYPATAEAIPFLLRLLREPSISDKDKILKVLLHISYAAALYQDGRADDTDRQNAAARDDDWPAEQGEDFEPSSEIEVEAHVAVREGAPTYATLLRDTPLMTRLMAATILSAFPDVQPSAREQLREIWANVPDEQTRSDITVVLGSLGKPSQEDRHIFAQAIRGTDELARFMSARALAFLDGKDASCAVLDVLLKSAVSPSMELQRRYSELTDGLYIEYQALAALDRLSTDRLSEGLPLLVEFLRRVDRPELLLRPEDKEASDARMLVFRLFDTVLVAVFGYDRFLPGGQRPPGALSQSQHKVLELLVASPLLWRMHNDHSSMVERYGIPGKRTDLARYLGLEADQYAHKTKKPWSIGKNGSPQGTYIMALHKFDATLARHASIFGRLTCGQNSDALVIDERVFRFPKHAQAIDEMERELLLLHGLQGKLPLPIPNPIYSSLEPREVGQAFMGYAKLPGKPLYREMLESVPGEQTVQRLAGQLGGFLHALHTLPVGEVFDFELPIVGSRKQWARMYNAIREKLSPLMRPDAREQVAAHFERALDDPATFAYMPALIHGDFGASNILYDAKSRVISGIIDWSSAGLGDPALDLAALICPASYGGTFAQCLTHVYPHVEELLPRARFYIGTFALQEALFGAEHDDAEALSRGLAQYV